MKTAMTKKRYLLVTLVSLFTLLYLLSCFKPVHKNVQALIQPLHTQMKAFVAPVHNKIKLFIESYGRRDKEVLLDVFNITTNGDNCKEKYVPESYLYNKKTNSWKEFHEFLKNPTDPLIEPQLPKLALDMYQPVSQPYFKRKKKKTVVIATGVHIGLPLDGRGNAYCADVEFISWERRHFPPMVKFFWHFVAPYVREKVSKLQKLMWGAFRNHPDMIRADIIMCGFDTWHCLAFAPFNKKIVMNHLYRFDGHIKTVGQNVKNLQFDLYKALRYNPDVINSGMIVYDIMYSKHFLGSDKTIPLPATCEYVHGSLKKEYEKKLPRCKNVPKTTTGYHPTKNVVSIFPKRYSKGGLAVATQIANYAKTVKGNPYGIEKLPEILGKQGGSYGYCELGQYQAVILLGYSLMSFFSCEVAAMSIPMFVPTPRLYAEWESKYHLIQERKSALDHNTYNDMKESTRTLQKGLNPNEDFQVETLRRWVAYADYYYTKGVQTFDNYEELFYKLKTTNFTQMHEMMLKHRIENNIRNHVNYRAISRYFFTDDGDNDHANPYDGESSADPSSKNSYMPRTIEEGMKLWNKKISRPDFSSNHSNNNSSKLFKGKRVYIIRISSLDDQISCAPPSDNDAIVYFSTSGSMEKKLPENCKLLNVMLFNGIENIINIRRYHMSFMEDTHAQLLFALIYAIQNGAENIVVLERKNVCALSTDGRKLVTNPEDYSEFVYDVKKQNLWLAWIPIPGLEYSRLWFNTVDKYNELSQHAADCMNFKIQDNLPDYELLRFRDYLSYWQTDETEEFFHIADQLNFELAVRGYTTKLYAELYRMWLHLLNHNVPESIPKLILK